MDISTCAQCQTPVDPGLAECPACHTPVAKQRFLGEILVDEGIISRDHLERALKLQKGRLGEILVEIGACKADQIDRALTLQHLGRTRADVYRGYLRFALLGLLVLSTATAWLLMRLQQREDLRLRIAEGTLTVDQVDSILSEETDLFKLDALRSLGPHVKEARAMALLGSALDDHRWHVRLYAAWMVKVYKVKALIPRLIPLLADEQRVVAIVAHDALRSLTGQSLDLSLKAWQDWAKTNGIKAN